MTPDPFSPTACAETVGILHALIRGIPDGACLNVALSPLTIAVALALLGAGIMALQMLVHRMFHGPVDPRTGRPVDQPDLSRREAANLARARQIERDHGF